MERIRMTENTFPDPGTPEAIKQGCRCPIKDNNHGRGFYMNGEKVFYMNEFCKLHGSFKKL